MTEQTFYSVGATTYGVTRLQQPTTPRAERIRRQLVVHWQRTDGKRLEMRWLPATRVS
jgi:hypothetical protein